MMMMMMVTMKIRVMMVMIMMTMMMVMMMVIDLELGRRETGNMFDGKALPIDDGQIGFSKKVLVSKAS